MRVKIDVSEVELDFIREALIHKYESLMNYLDDCEQNSFINSPEYEEIKKGFTVQMQQAEKKPHWTQTPEGKKKMAARKRRGARK